MSVLDCIYAHLPVSLQNISISVYGYYWRWLRFGNGYSVYLRTFEQREFFSDLQWKNWQQEQLRKLLISCLSTPYYSQNWTLEQKKAAREGRLSDLPFLEKKQLRANSKSFLRSDIHPKRILTFFTSGSTGTPIASYWTISELRASIALREKRSAKWAGVSFSEPRATFSGRMIEPNPDSTGPFYRFNFAENQVYFSPFHLRPDTAKEYIDALSKHNVRWLTGYAVSYYLLSKFILDQDIKVPATIKAVITTSEKLTEEMRDVIKKAFHCQVFEEYSTVENVIFASECEKGNLHISPDAGIVEIIRPDGSQCAPGEIGEVVATCLLKTFQPLVRYRLGDMAAISDEICSCGRSMPIIKEVVGRIEDVVTGPDGRQMVRFHGIFTGQPHILEGQIIQESVELIIVRIVASDGFSIQDESDLISRVTQRLGKQIKVNIEKVDFIPRTKAGKFQAVISKITV